MLLAVALGLVVIRAVLAAWSAALPVIGIIEVLEGVSMGLAGVAIPALPSGSCWVRDTATRPWVG